MDDLAISFHSLLYYHIAVLANFCGALIHDGGVRLEDIIGIVAQANTLQNEFIQVRLQIAVFKTEFMQAMKEFAGFQFFHDKADTYLRFSGGNDLSMPNFFRFH
ncbi:MAG: hypothetical protein HC859_04075 [Bacteroidia bacterium]|nr:hypothetical protein [Bacteroidia bacterium]